jgi:hypothetical protein
MSVTKQGAGTEGELKRRPESVIPDGVLPVVGRSRSLVATEGSPVRSLPVSAETLDRLVGELNRVLRTETVNLHLALGRVVIERLYRGEFSRWRNKGAKESSFRKLAARSGRGLAVSATSLYRAVALYELFDRLGVSSWKHLGVSHLRGVLGLPDTEQRRLLTAAESEGWTVEQLERESARIRHHSGAKRGRPPLPPVVKTVHRLASLVEKPNESLAGMERLGEMTPPQIQHLITTVAEIKRQLDLVAECLTARAGPGK